MIQNELSTILGRVWFIGRKMHTAVRSQSFIALKRSLRKSIFDLLSLSLDFQRSTQSFINESPADESDTFISICKGKAWNIASSYSENWILLISRSDLRVVFVNCCIFSVLRHLLCNLKTSGWPSGLRRCVKVAVSSGGVGSNPTSDILVGN